MLVLWFLSLIFSLITAYDGKDLTIGGTTAPGWGLIRKLFEENFLDGQDLGASVAVYYQGKPVVDLWGGWFDESKTRLYDNNTLQIPFSTTKGLVAGAVALCVQRGLLNYSSPVRRYWQEYGQNGKENTTVADILSHRAGLPANLEPLELALNWTAAIEILEKRKPEWEPGKAYGYHGLTYGWLAGELVRRVDPKKRSFGQFILDEISKPLNIEFYIGLPKANEVRVSPIVFDSNVRTVLGTEAVSEMSALNNQQYHQAEIPGANGITNARSVARFYSSLIGDLENPMQKRLLNEETMNKATTSNTLPNEVDRVTGLSNGFSMGFQVLDNGLEIFESKAFGHEGAGGSLGFAIPKKKLAFAYITNRYGVKKNRKEISPRTQKIIQHIATLLNKT